MTTTTNNIARRGFASMPPDVQRRVASMGGKEAHRLGRAHKWNSEEAREAGKIGGAISRRRYKQARFKEEL